MRSLALLLVPACLASAEPVVRDSAFAESPEGWEIWSPRDEIAPKGWSDPRVDRGEGGSLALSGVSRPGVFGGWRRTADVEPGGWYKLTAHYRLEGRGTIDERQAVVSRLAWARADGKRAGQPEYAYRIEREGEWRRVTLTARAPEDAVSATIELLLVNAPQVSAWFDDVSLEAVDAPEPRLARIATVNLRPRHDVEPRTPLGNIEQFAQVIEDKVGDDVDLILLPEGTTVVRTGLPYAEVAEPIPGPVTLRLGEIARSKNAYLAAGVYEREGTVIYNTAVLLDRQGELVGKYRKVYLPREEYEAGLTPGADFPVFDTDFGRVGMMICWDVQYADPARALALRGAEVLLMPIWGGNMTLAEARAVENQVFLVSSGYDHPTYVMDPKGEILSRADEEGTVAEAVIDLNRRYLWEWTGEMRGRFFHELRRDVAVVP